MRILIIISSEPEQRILVKLHTEELEREIRELIVKRKHRRAIVSALSNGRFEKEVSRHELPEIRADLILTEDSASWDLTSM